MSYQKKKKRGMAAREQAAGKKLGHSLRNFCIAGFFLAFVFGCFLHHQQLQDQIAAVHLETQAVESQMDEELEKQIDLKAKQSYLQTDDYYARLARERFHLLKEGEHMYVFE